MGIQLSQYRIGNIIDFHYEQKGDPYPAEITQIFYAGVEVTNQRFESVSQAWVEYLINDVDIAPIRINDNWLIALGFENNYSSKYRTKYDHKINLFIGYDFSHDDDIGMEGFRFYGHYIRCEYVHQLQNLYFALTQNELTIK